MAVNKALNKLEAAIVALKAETLCWEGIHSKMNAYFEAAGLGLRWEDGDLVNRPELAHPAPNRNIADYE